MMNCSTNLFVVDFNGDGRSDILCVIDKQFHILISTDSNNTKSGIYIFLNHS